jgi:hypothetical protein
MAQFTPFPLTQYLTNLGTPSIGQSPVIQASQLLQHLLDASRNLTRTHWADSALLLQWLNGTPARAIVAKATNNALITPSGMLEFAYQLADSFWQALPEPPLYPDETPGAAERQRFIDLFIDKAIQHAPTMAVLSLDQLHWVANIIDLRRLQSIQQAQIEILGQAATSTDAAPPTFTNQLLKPVIELIQAAGPTLDPVSIYAAQIHASSEIAPAPAGNEPGVTVTYNNSIAGLIADLLRSGIAPHTVAGHEWNTLQISVREDLHGVQTTSSPVDPQDLLKEDPVNYSNFKLHPYLPLTRAAFDHFVEQIRQLMPQYQQTLRDWWSGPGAPARQSRLEQDGIRLKAFARLGLADGTLDPGSHAAILAVLDESNPAPRLPCYCLSFEDPATYRCYPLSELFVIAPLLSEGIALEQHDGPLICFAPDSGFRVLQGFKALTADMSERTSHPGSLQALLRCLHGRDPALLTLALAENPARITLRATPLALPLLATRMANCLKNQSRGVSNLFDNIKARAPVQGLAVMAGHIDKARESWPEADFARLYNERDRRLIESLADQTLYDAWLACRRVHSDWALTFFDTPSLQMDALSDEQRRERMIRSLSVQQTQHRVEEVLGHLPHYFTAAVPGTAISYSVVQKIYRHELDRRAVTWTVPDSNGYKAFFLEHVLAQYSGRVDASFKMQLIEPLLLGLRPWPSERITSRCTSQELDQAQARVRTGEFDLLPHLGITSARPDLTALGRRLRTFLLYPDDGLSAADAPYVLDRRIFMELVCDSPAFHELEQLLGLKSDMPARVRRALTLAVITDYLEAGYEPAVGQVCGLNLNSVAFGERPVREVREQVRQHLLMALGTSPIAGAEPLAFLLLMARHAPELIIEQVPGDLKYGQSLDAVEFRHAVALIEAMQPGASLLRSYPELMKLYAGSSFAQISEDEQMAVAISGKTATLHFAMCRGVIPSTPVAQVSPEHVLKALTYLHDQQELTARTFTQLTQIPPVRRAMALERLKSQPFLDLQRETRFSPAEVDKYFVNRFLSTGRAMRMTVLERYMTCGTGRSFTDSELGFVPNIEGGCALQAEFDTLYEAFKSQWQQGLVARMAMALHDLPALDRDRILNAYKFIKVAFKDDEGNELPAYYAMIALYKNGDEEYAYELFCPSGTIRLLERDGDLNLRVKVRFGPPSQDEIYHESPIIAKVKAFDQGAYLYGQANQVLKVPHLEVSFYTIARQASELDRDGKIKLLCEKMVDKVFGKAVEQAYDTLRGPTPYERYRDGLKAKTEQLAKVLIPGYSIYLDISRGTVNPGTFIFGALEAVTLLLPFGTAILKALQVYVQVGRLVVRATSFGVSRLALKSAQVAYGARQFASVLGRGIAEAVNPLGLGIFLFQGGVKGVQLLQAGVRFARRQLGGSALSRQLLGLSAIDVYRYTLPSRVIPGLPGLKPQRDLSLFKADFSTGRNVLTIPQQQQLVAHGVNLSDTVAVLNLHAQNGKTYIRMQGHAYEVRKSPGQTQWRIYTDDWEGPLVRFNGSSNAWEVAC